MDIFNYTGKSSIIKRITHLLNRKAPLPLDGDGDPSWGSNGQVLTTDGTGSTYWSAGGGGDVTDVEVNGTSVVNAQGVAEVSVPTKTSDLNNDSDFIDSTDLSTALADYTPTASLASVATSGQYSDLSGTPSLATVATSGDYDDLTNKPTIPAAQVNSDWNAASGVAQILNKPTIPTVNDGTLTIQQNGTTVGTFSANQSGNTTVNLTGGGGSGGHTIEDTSGTAMTQRTGLQFVGADVTDDSVNNRTVVTVQKVYLGDLRSLGSSTPANTAISYFENDIPNNTVAIAYNSLGDEYTIIFSRGGSANYGTVLKYGYSQKDIYILRKINGTWQNSDWEKIDAGYAATAGSATSATNDGNGNAIDSTYLKIAGDTMTGLLKCSQENKPVLSFRTGNASWSDYMTHYTGGNECFLLSTKNAITSLMFVNGEDSSATTDSNRWMSLTPGLQIKNNKVAIGKLIANGVTPTYTLDVGGTINASNTITQNGTAVMLKSDVEVIPLTLSATTSWQTYTGSTTNVVKACSVNVVNNGSQYNFFYGCSHAGNKEFQLHYRCADGNATMYCEVIIFS